MAFRELRAYSVSLNGQDADQGVRQDLRFVRYCRKLITAVLARAFVRLRPTHADAVAVQRHHHAVGNSRWGDKAVDDVDGDADAPQIRPQSSRKICTRIAVEGAKRFG